jgi:hypothetical protein
MPQTFPATFAGFFRHKTIGAMGKSLVLDGSRCFSGEQAHADPQAKMKIALFMESYLLLRKRIPADVGGCKLVVVKARPGDLLSISRRSSARSCR